MTKLSEKQLAAVNALPAEPRYRHFVKQVADNECVWGLYQGGWALAANDSGRDIFPVWPAREYAEQCAVGDWQEYTPRAIPLDDFLNELLPRLDGDELSVGVAYLPHDIGVVVDPQQLKADIQEELELYE